MPIPVLKLKLKLCYAMLCYAYPAAPLQVLCRCQQHQSRTTDRDEAVVRTVWPGVRDWSEVMYIRTSYNTKLQYEHQWPIPLADGKYGQGRQAQGHVDITVRSTYWHICHCSRGCCMQSTSFTRYEPRLQHREWLEGQQRAT
jgi:hypothetical protein